MADSPDTGAGVCQVAVSLTDGSSGPGSDVLLRFGASNTVADLRTGLARFASARVPGLADDQPVAGGDEVGEQRLAELGIFTGVDLRVGATVSVENGWPRPGWRGDALELAVIGGLVAGGRARLTEGQVTVGRSAGCDVRVDDPDVSRVHLAISMGPEGVSIEDLHSANGTTVDGRPLVGRAPLPLGSMIAIGSSILTVRRSDDAAAGVEPAGDGRVRFNKPPRSTPWAEAPVFTVPSAPSAPTSPHVSVAAAVAPAVLGVAIAAVTGQYTFLLFALLSPVVVGVNLWSNRRSGRRSYAAKQQEYEQQRAQLSANVTEAVQADQAVRRRALPDPAAVRGLARLPSQRLWERRPTDPDFGELRIGLGSAPANLVLRGEADVNVPDAALVPISVRLPDCGVVGLAGPREPLLDNARAILAHLVALHGPGDLSLVVISDGPAGDWEWAKWLPHTAPGDQDCLRLFGMRPAQRTARIDELLALIEARAAGQTTRVRGEAPRWPAVVVVLDGVRRLRADSRVAALLRSGPAVAVYALCLADDRAGLPAETGAAILLSRGGEGAVLADVDVAGRTVSGVLPDGLSASRATDLARDMAPLYEVAGAQGSTTGVPEPPVDELAVLGVIGDPTEAVTRRWNDAAAGGRAERRPAAPIGRTASGLFEVDLRRDGPHALVAGTTGSGKSELLQTLVAALAASVPPEELTFLLVDFKGGSAFRACEELPHTVGVISNLDGRLVERALDSIQAELKWRQARFAAADASDFEDYQTRTAAGQVPIPRLVIVVDELKELVDAYGAAIARLSQTARLGRSLGVHLVVATQKPASVTGLADLRANTDLRICLRVQEATESTDIIGVADAATIRRADQGRALARSGDGGLTVFQSGYLGMSRRPEAQRMAVRVDPFDADVVGEPRPAAETSHSAAPANGGERAPTGLELLVDAARSAADARGTRPPRRPWLPPLADIVTLAEVGSAGRQPGRRGAAQLPVGLIDRPDEQTQEPLLFDLDRLGHVVVSGPTRSGRTTVLRTLAGAAASLVSVGDLHIYVIESRGRSLRDLERLPHCGAALGLDDVERLERLLDYLDAELTRRQGFGGEGRGGDQGGDRGDAPYLLVLVDGFEGYYDRFAYEDGGRLVERFAALLARGPALGLHAVITTDRRGAPGKLTTPIESKLVLRPVDRDDQVSLGLRAASVADSMPPGRGYWSDGPAEVQVALLEGGATPEAQAAAIAAIARAAELRDADVSPERRPQRVPPLPPSISWTESTRLRRRPRPQGRSVITLAVGGTEVEPIDVDLATAGLCFVVAGPRGSGRSTALTAVVRSLLWPSDDRNGPPAAGLPVCVVAPRRSPLRTFLSGRGLPGVSLLTDADSLASDVPAAVEAAEGRLALVIDDAELLLDNPVSGRLDRIVRAAADRDGLVILAGTTSDLVRRFSGWIFDARQGRTGIILQPSGPADGDVFDLRLPRSTGSLPQPAGRGILVVRGVARPAQVVIDDEAMSAGSTATGSHP